MLNSIIQKDYKYSLFNDLDFKYKKISFPSTRYQGSKYKLVDWINYNTRHLKFKTVLDAFGGTGCVSYMFKKQGKQVFYNDILKFNGYIATALIKNSTEILEQNDINFILTKHLSIKYPTFIQDNFKDIYFTQDENKWLDIVITNIFKISNKYKKAIALYALFQSCIIKRPYNLFHRKNLYIRTSNVTRTFGNKKTWDTSFEEHFKHFIEEANNAIFDNNRENLVFCEDALNLNIYADLVYIDTPYISSKGTGVDYLSFYHFLEGLVNYKNWNNLIDNRTKNKKMFQVENNWCNKEKIYSSFKNLFCKFKKSIIVVSYRENGIPTIDELINILRIYKNKIEVKTIDYKYVLSNNNTKEVLIIAS